MADVLTSKMYIRLENTYGRPYHQEITAFKFEDTNLFQDFEEVYIPKGHKRVVKCKCGGNSWSDNGRFINEYECECCGRYLEVYYPSNH